jgi:hypothetical protein
LESFNTVVRCTVLTFVFVAGAVSIAGLSPVQKNATESLATEQAPVAPVEKPFTSSEQKALQADLGSTG